MPPISRLLVASAACAGLLGTVPDARAAGPCERDDITRIHEIQGAGHVSPHLGELVSTCGVVTAVAFNGYFIQDPEGDGDDETSEGLFVFDRREPDTPISVGELLRLRDRVEEFIPGGAATGNLSITQLSFPTILSRTPGKLPSPVIIGRGGRIPPNVDVISEVETEPPINLQDPADAAENDFNPEQDGIDFYESLEGMLVTVENPVAVSAVRQFSTFSAEVFVLANNGQDVAPGNGRNARGGIDLQPDPDNRGDQNPERVQIQFDRTLFGSTDYPPVKVGDRLGDVTGVVGYSFGNFEVNALGPFDLFPVKLHEERTRLRGRGDRLTVATYNVLNLSAVSGDDEQRAKIGRQIAHNLRAPDVIALQEIQDNNGDVNDCPSSNPDPCSNVLDASETLRKLADAIVAAGGPEYRFLTVDPLVETTDDDRDDPDAFGGVALGNIRNAFLWNPDRVDLLSSRGLTREVLAKEGVSASTAYDTSRDPLEAVFGFRGETIGIVNNHFSSRFGSTPIFGGPQPFVQAAEEMREAQALAMNEYARSRLADDSSARIVILGDLNTFEFTDDLAEILPGTDEDRILYNLFGSNRGDDRYSFNFEGNSQALDHVFVSRALRGGAKLDFVHVNVDFPRLFSDVVASDHEPVVVRLEPARDDGDKDGDDDRYDDDRDDDNEEDDRD